MLELLSLTLFLQIVACVLLVFFVDHLPRFLQVVHIPMSFRIIILLMAIFNGIVNWMFERFFVMWMCTNKK